MEKVNIYLIFLMTFFVSCTDIFQKDISKETVTVLSPGDTTTNYTNTFWWNSVDGAANYRVQIVSPSFNSITKLYLDSAVSSTKMLYTLSPGSYQWRVRGENGTSYTNYVTKDLVVDTVSLSTQSVNLTGPSANDYLNSKSVTFQWDAIYSADSYEIQIDTANGGFSGAVKADQIIPTNTYIYTFANEGTFQWRVKATNSTESTPYTSVRKFTIDVTKPGAVTLSSPADNLTNAARPLSLAWTNPSQNTDVASFKVYLYKVVSGTPTLLINPVTVTSTTYSFNLGAVGDNIQWKVSAIDYAGNESTVTTSRSFIIGS